MSRVMKALFRLVLIMAVVWHYVNPFVSVCPWILWMCINRATPSEWGESLHTVFKFLFLSKHPCRHVFSLPTTLAHYNTIWLLHAFPWLFYVYMWRIWVATTIKVWCWLLIFCKNQKQLLTGPERCFVYCVCSCGYCCSYMCSCPYRSVLMF